MSRKPNTLELGFLMGWHGVLSGAFIVAFITMDGPMNMHRFAGFVVIFAILARLLVATMAPVDSPLYVPRPSLSGLVSYLVQAKGRNPLIAWMATALLISIGMASISGLMADAMRGLDDFHEGVAMVAPIVIGAHIALVLLGHWMKSIRKLAEPASATPQPMPQTAPIAARDQARSRPSRPLKF